MVDKKSLENSLIYFSDGKVGSIGKVSFVTGLPQDVDGRIKKKINEVGMDFYLEVGREHGIVPCVRTTTHYVCGRYIEPTS